MKECPKVSIVIPAKNEERYIALCLESLKGLKYPKEKYEIYVVDNGSEDHTKTISESYGVNLLSKQNGTIASIRNFGASKSNGEIIAFLDADCVVPSNWLLEGLKYLTKNDEVSAVGFKAAPPDSKDPWVEKCWHLLSSASRFKGTVQVKWLSSFNLMIKRKYFEKVNGFNEEMVTCEDVDVGLRLSEISKLVFSDRISIRHLGSVKTIRGFFLKELWRGQNNLKSFYKIKNNFGEILSTFIPFLFLLAIVLSPVILYFNCNYIYFALCFIFILPIAMIIYKSKSRGILIKNFYKLWLIAFLYLLARGLAVLKEMLSIFRYKSFERR